MAGAGCSGTSRGSSCSPAPRRLAARRHRLASASSASHRTGPCPPRTPPRRDGRRRHGGLGAPRDRRCPPAPRRHRRSGPRSAPPGSPRRSRAPRRPTAGTDRAPARRTRRWARCRPPSRSAPRPPTPSPRPWSRSRAPTAGLPVGSWSAKMSFRVSSPDSWTGRPPSPRRRSSSSAASSAALLGGLLPTVSSTGGSSTGVTLVTRLNCTTSAMDSSASVTSTTVGAPSPGRGAGGTSWIARTSASSSLRSMVGSVSSACSPGTGGGTGLRTAAGGGVTQHPAALVVPGHGVATGDVEVEHRLPRGLARPVVRP